VGWPVLFWLCRVEIITELGQDVQMFIDDQQDQIIIITLIVKGATGQHPRSKCQLAFHSRSFRVTLNQIKCIYIVLRTSADISKCCTETQPKTPNSKQCRCRSTLARKNSLERPNPKKKLREEPNYEGWPVLFWLCRVKIITEHGQDVQMFINDQHGPIIIRQNS
jgi:hypothetical protein